MEIYVKPSDILFSVAVVDNKFHKHSHHSYCPIGETLDLLCEGKIKISDIPKISVVKRSTKWLTINNRRLWIFRQMERLGKCETIPVLVSEEITLLTHECDDFMNANVRENPGGLWYLLPSCKMKDPFSKIVTNTVKNIKKNMFPPPSRRMIITIFQNLAQVKVSQEIKDVNGKNLLNENQRGNGNSSEERTLSSGYLDVRMGEFNVTQIDVVEKKRRIHQWIVDQSVSRDVIKYDLGIKAHTIELLPSAISDPYHSVPGGSLRCFANNEIDRISVISTVSQQGSLPADTSEGAERLSAASCPTSGYLFVKGEGNENWDSEQSVDTGKCVSKANDDDFVYKHEENEKLHPKGSQQYGFTEERQHNPNEITRDIIHGIENILSKKPERQSEFSKQIPDIHLLIETRIQQTSDMYNQKCKYYESEIEALKNDINNLLLTKNEEIENLRQEAEAAKRELHELQKYQTSVLVRGPSSGVAANSHISEALNCTMDVTRTRILEIPDALCNFGFSLAESQCPAVYSSRRRTDSEQTITEATAGELDEREDSRQENEHDGLDLDFHIELRNNENPPTDLAMSEYQLQDVPCVLGML